MDMVIKSKGRQMFVSFTPQECPEVTGDQIHAETISTKGKRYLRVS